MTAAPAYDSPQTVHGRLEEIEKDLAERAGEYEEAARNRARYIRDWEKRLASHRVSAKGSDADSRKAAALGAAIDQDDLYENLKRAEGEFEALKCVMKVLETRAMIGLGILKSQGRA